MFFIILIVNILIVYPFVQWQIKQPKVEIQTVHDTKTVNITPDDQSAFGDAIMSDGWHSDDGKSTDESGWKIKDACPNGVSFISPSTIKCK